MRKTILLFSLLGLFSCDIPIVPGIQSNAQAMEAGISVVVNDEAISQMQINDRIKLLMTSSGMPDTPQMRAELEPKVRDMLINEKLKMQEAERSDVTVSDEEIQGGIATIARNNNLPPQQFERIIAAQNIPRRTLEDQIRSQIAWGKVVESKLRPQIEVSENDIDNELERLKDNPPEGGLPERDQVLNKIGMERLNRLQHRYMQDLRAEAFIEDRG